MILRGFVTQASYRIERDADGRRWPVVHLYGRGEDGSSFLVRDHRQRPHFYVRARDAGRARELGAAVFSTEWRTFDGQAAARVERELPGDVPALRDALHAAGVVAAFEFRHGSWLNDATYQRLAARNLALCVADSETMETPVVVTADYAYFRLRDEGYTPADIERWAQTLRDRTAQCRDVYVYFKHEEAGKGPQFARLLLDALGLP